MSMSPTAPPWKSRSPEELRAHASKLYDLADKRGPEDALRLRNIANGFRLVAVLKERRAVSEPRPASLRDMYDEAAGGTGFDKAQLAHRHMLILADTFEGWAMAEGTKPSDTARLVGWSEVMRRLADEVGEDWNPPEPTKLSLCGFLGRTLLGEPVYPESTPRGKRD